MNSRERLQQLACNVQDAVFRARLDGRLGSLNDDLSKEKLKPFLAATLAEYGHTLSEEKLLALTENFPLVEVEADEHAGTRESSARGIEMLLGWALPELSEKS